MITRHTFGHLDSFGHAALSILVFGNYFRFLFVNSQVDYKSICISRGHRLGSERGFLKCSLFPKYKILSFQCFDS